MLQTAAFRIALDTECDSTLILTCDYLQEISFSDDRSLRAEDNFVI